MTGVAKRAPEMEFWFEFGSTCSYLTVSRAAILGGSIARLWPNFC